MYLKLALNTSFNRVLPQFSQILVTQMPPMKHNSPLKCVFTTIKGYKFDNFYNDDNNARLLSLILYIIFYNIKTYKFNQPKALIYNKQSN